MNLQIREIHLSINSDSASSSTSDVEQVNTDVIVYINEASDNNEITTHKYIASFFAYKNIAQLNAEHQNDGQFLAGDYFYAKNMLLIKDCSKETITSVINNLIDEGSFKDVFLKI